MLFYFSFIFFEEFEFFEVYFELYEIFEAIVIVNVISKKSFDIVAYLVKEEVNDG